MEMEIEMEMEIKIWQFELTMIAYLNGHKGRGTLIKP